MRCVRDGEIGDDVAVRLCDRKRLIVTADTSIENTRFDLNIMPFEEVENSERRHNMWVSGVSGLSALCNGDDMMLK